MIQKYINIEVKVFEKSKKDSAELGATTRDILEKELNNKNCKCRWCGTKVEKVTHPEKIYCSNCGWLLWKINTTVIDYQYRGWIPIFYKSVMCIDLEWDNIKEYYMRSKNMLETEQLDMYKAIEEENRLRKWNYNEWEKYFFY